MARPSYEPSPADRNTVKNMAACGFKHEEIAKCLGDYGIAPKTLRKHFRNELDRAGLMANATVGSKIFERAKNGDAWACCFWMKARAGWKETQVSEHVGAEGGPITLAVLDAMRHGSKK